MRRHGRPGVNPHFSWWPRCLHDLDAHAEDCVEARLFPLKVRPTFSDKAAHVDAFAGIPESLAEQVAVCVRATSGWAKLFDLAVITK